MRPLLTFGLGAYNQAQFVAAAVRSALGQTYSPLQIILSDDCSTDQTFAIMQETAANYRGPHSLVFNRNATNVGLSEHVNRIVRMAKGELIVAAAGDDVSLPNRTAELFEAWDAARRKPNYVYSRMIHIDRSGRELDFRREESKHPRRPAVEQSATPDSYVDTLKPEIFGCVGAYSPSLFEIFGDLPPRLIHEDAVIGLRSVLVGGVLFVDAPLVKYRCHGNNMFNGTHGCATTLRTVGNQERRLPLDFANRATMYEAFCEDLSRARDLRIISPAEHLAAAAIARQKMRVASLTSEFLSSSTRRKFCILLQLARTEVPPEHWRTLLMRLLPAPLFHSAKLVRNRLRIRRQSRSR